MSNHKVRYLKAWFQSLSVPESLDRINELSTEQPGGC